MAKRRASRAATRAPARRTGLLEAFGLLLVGLGLLCGLALATHAPWDEPFQLGPVSNRAGAAGASLAWVLFRGLGLGAWAAATALVLCGGRLAIGRGLPTIQSRFWVGVALLLVALPPLATAWEAVAGRPLGAGGGRLGEALAVGLAALVGSWGTLLVTGLVAVLGLLAVCGISVRRAAEATSAGAALVGRAVARLAAGAARAGHAAGVRASAGARSAWESAARGVRELGVWRARRARWARVAAAREVEIAGEAEEEAAETPPETPRRRRGGEPDIVDHRSGNEPSAPRQETFSFNEGGTRGPYALPEISVFEPPSETRRSYDRESLIMNSRILEKKLGDFGIQGRVVTVHPGPVVTMYEYEPASGVKLTRIVGLGDDLALALRALSVRIIAPLPGKSVVGIEVANAQREIVHIREVLESGDGPKKRSKLTIPLGKDIFGNPVETDLARMPHLLVAGATGTGKSVFLNALLCSILFRTTPDELKLLLVDPKLLELSVYEGIPHLVADVVTNPKRAAAALHGIVHKMEERYRWMQALQVRSIAQFNEKVQKLQGDGETHFQLKARPGEEEREEVELRTLPYILVVIDELADLMVVSARDVEEALQRLAQMARAAGIHLVLATQRPSVDVLTGVIKANFPARISFQVSSRTDSRTILDQNGAEHLLGQGDMLFLPPGTSKLQRIHGAYVSESEVEGLVEFLRQQGAPQFDETLIRLREESEAQEARGEDVDEMYDRAIAIVAETRNASISYIQRRLKVGYNRAARMIEQMELDGIVGPQDGSKGREVFARPMELE